MTDGRNEKAREVIKDDIKKSKERVKFEERAILKEDVKKEFFAVATKHNLSLLELREVFAMAQMTCEIIDSQQNYKIHFEKQQKLQSEKGNALTNMVKGTPVEKEAQPEEVKKPEIDKGE